MSDLEPVIAALQNFRWVTAVIGQARVLRANQRRPAAESRAT